MYEQETLGIFWVLMGLVLHFLHIIGRRRRSFRFHPSSLDLGESHERIGAIQSTDTKHRRLTLIFNATHTIGDDVIDIGSLTNFCTVLIALTSGPNLVRFVVDTPQKMDLDTQNIRSVFNRSTSDSLQKYEELDWGLI